MSIRNITFQLATVTLACLSGLIANTPAAIADSEEETPAAINQLNAVKVDSTKPLAAAALRQLAAIPADDDFEASHLGTTAAELLTIEQPTEIVVSAINPSTVTLAQSAAIPALSNVEVTEPRTTDTKAPKITAELLTVKQLVKIDAPVPSAVIPVTPTVDTVGLISHSAADLQSNGVLPLEEQLPGAMSEQLLFTEEADLDNLCRLFPLNSRCTQRPAEIDTAEPQPARPSTDTTSTNTRAAKTKGFYFSLGGGLQEREDAEDFIGRASFRDGFKLNGAVGYRFNDLRTELEYTYFKNEFDELTFFTPGTTDPVPGPPETSRGAFVDGRAIMLNLYYDIPTGSRLKPYIGAGIGIYNAFINHLAPPSFGGFRAYAFSSSRFAFQLRAGLSYALTNALNISLGYRYFKGDRFEYDVESSPLVLRPNGLETNNIELNLRYNF